MNDGEELDSWSVIINGHVEIDGGASGEPGRALHLGDRSVNLSIQLRRKKRKTHFPQPEFEI
jgi:hypothetical protein